MTENVKVSLAILGTASLLIGKAKENLSYETLETPEKPILLPMAHEVQHLNLNAPDTKRVAIQDLVSVGEDTIII